MSVALPRMALMTLIASLPVIEAAAQSASPDGVPGPDAPTSVQSAPNDPWSAIAPELSMRESRPLKRRAAGDDSPVIGQTSGGAGRGGMRTLGALAGVVGLIVFLAWGYRALSGGSLSLVGKPRRPGLISVISKTPLSARQSLCLVRVGPRLVLIGQSHDTLRALDVIDDPELAARLVGESARQRSDSSQADFDACLEREASGYADSRDVIDESIAPDARRIADVRQGLTSTIRRIRRAVAQA